MVCVNTAGRVKRFGEAMENELHVFERSAGQGIRDDEVIKNRFERTR
jgi:hypothetical protein